MKNRDLENNCYVSLAASLLEYLVQAKTIIIDEAGTPDLMFDRNLRQKYRQLALWCLQMATGDEDYFPDIFVETSPEIDRPFFLKLRKGFGTDDGAPVEAVPLDEFVSFLMTASSLSNALLLTDDGHWVIIVPLLLP